MKVTLKLTDNECRVVSKESKYMMIVERCIEDGSGGVIEVLDVDKFREFLNDEMGFSDRFVCSTLKSILSKLDKAVVHNNEPKDETLEKLIGIINWAEGKWGVGECTDNIIVKAIKEDILKWELVDEPFKCDACDGSGSIQDGGGEGVYGSCDACDGDGFAK